MNPEAVPNSPNITVTPLEFRDLGDPTSLFRDFLYSENADICRYWPNRDVSLNEFAAEALSEYQTDRKLLCDALRIENGSYGAGTETFENIDRLRRPDCVAVVTGQQSGLFAGPAYTVYKALSTIKLTETLRRAGVNAVPLFWIASEDHDFDEVSAAYFQNRNQLLDRVQVSRNEAHKGFPVGKTPIEPEIEAILNHFFDEIEPSMHTDTLRSELSNAYEQNTDLSTAFGRLMTSWLSKYGLVFTNPLNPVIRALSAPIFAEAVKSYAAIRSGLADANKELRESGYNVQVDVQDDYLPLFYISEQGRRSVLRESGGIVRSKDNSFECPVTELAAKVTASPGSFSPNALFRPVVQDWVFPTVCYVGGAAEIAYFAQNASVYKSLERPVTPVRHRASFTILEARHRRTLQKYDLSVVDLWSGYDSVSERVVSRFAHADTKQKLKETGEAIEGQLRVLSETISGLDHGLAENFEKREKKILWHVEAIKRKFMLYEERRNGDLIRRLQDLFVSGWPKGGPQERVISFASHLNRHGPRLLDWLYLHVDETGREHRIVSF